MCVRALVCAHFVVFLLLLFDVRVARRGRSDTCCAWLILFSETACVCVELFLFHMHADARARPS